MSDIEHEGDSAGGDSAASDTVRAAQGLGIIGVTYNWLAESVNLLAGVLMPARETGLLPLLFDFPLNPGHLFPFLWPLWYCIIIGFICYLLIAWVCERRWVKRTYVIGECVQINPFGFFFCFWKIVTVWVLVIICRWRYWIICIPIWICFVVWIWRWFY